MDSLQQKFGGEPEIITRHPYRKIIVFIAIGSMVASTLWGYVLWQKNQVIPTVSIAPEVVLTDAEVETYRAALPRTYATADYVDDKGNEEPFFNSIEAEVVELADTDVVTPTSAELFVPPTQAVTISLTDAARPVAEGGGVSDAYVKAYVEGEVTVSDFVVEQPDRADKENFSGTGVVAAVDGGLGQILVTCNGQVMTIDMKNTKLSTADGKLIPINSLRIGDVLRIEGQKLVASPVIIEASLQLVGLMEFIQVIDIGI